MKWPKSWLLQQPNGEFSFEETLTFDSDIIKSTRYLLGLKEVSIEGEGTYHRDTETLTLDFIIKGTMVVPCALSLEPVDYSFETTADVKYTFNPTLQNEEILVVKGMEIDIIPFVWELISLEIPLKVVKPGAHIKTQGNNWEIKSQDDDSSKKDLDPRLAKLNEFFKEK